MQSPRDIPLLAGIGTYTRDARAWICDIWGVVHNGVTAYPDAVSACAAYRAGGGRIILVSNAPRPSDGVVRQLDALGVPRAVYDAVLTSGDVTRAELGGWLGIPTLHIGPERDRTLFDGLDIPRVDAGSAARILCSGLYDDTSETPETYRAMLEGLAARHVPMLCANPDIKVDRGGRIIYCGGAVAGLYGDLGGAVTYAGKPYPAIYATARRMLRDLTGDDIPPDRILAIGDGVHTDISGGIAAGMRTVYIASAIHVAGPLTQRTLAELFPEPTQRPSVAMQALAW